MRSKEIGIENARPVRPSRTFSPNALPCRSGSRRPLSLRRAGLILVGLGLLWRAVRYAVGMPIWGDEAFVAVHFFGRSLADMTRPMEYHQVAPVGFLWVELLTVRLLGASEWSLRLWPFLSGVATLLLFDRFCSRWLARREALLAVGILAASFYPIRHSAEVKPYAGDLFLAMAMLAVGWKIHQAERPLIRDWLALSAIGAVGVWLSYPLIFVAASIGTCLALRFRKEPRQWPMLVVLAVTVIASWLVFFWGISPPPTKAEGEFDPFGPTWAWAFPPWRNPLKLAWWILDIHTGNMLAYPVGGKNFASSGTLLLALLGVRSLWKSGRATLLGFLLGPLVPLFLAAALEKYPYGTSARVSLFMAPAFCLLAGVGASSLFLSLRHRISPLAGHFQVAALLGIFAIAGLVLDIAVPYKTPDDLANRRAVAKLAERTHPGDRWVVFDGIRELPRTKNLMLETWLQQQAEVRFYILQQAPVPLQWMPADPSAIEAPGPGGRLWLIVNRAGYEAYPEAEESSWRAVLGDRFGEPERILIDIEPGRSIEAFLYPAVSDRSGTKENRPAAELAPGGAAD